MPSQNLPCLSCRVPIVLCFGRGAPLIVPARSAVASTDYRCLSTSTAHSLPSPLRLCRLAQSRNAFTSRPPQRNRACRLQSPGTCLETTPPLHFLLVATIVSGHATDSSAGGGVCFGASAPAALLPVDHPCNPRDAPKTRRRVVLHPRSTSTSPAGRHLISLQQLHLGALVSSPSLLRPLPAASSQSSPHDSFAELLMPSAALERRSQSRSQRLHGPRPIVFRPGVFASMSDGTVHLIRHPAYSLGP